VTQFDVVHVLLISTYDLGRQPFGLASPAAWLREAGVQVTCADLSREKLPEDAVRGADLVAFFLPMHTATRLAVPVIDRVRDLNGSAALCAYGLYAPLNAAVLRERGVTYILASCHRGPTTRLPCRVACCKPYTECTRPPPSSSWPYPRWCW
jgi:hypothetical protein